MSRLRRANRSTFESPESTAVQLHISLTSAPCFSDDLFPRCDSCHVPSTGPNGTGCPCGGYAGLRCCDYRWRCRADHPVPRVHVLCVRQHARQHARGCASCDCSGERRSRRSGGRGHRCHAHVPAEHCTWGVAHIHYATHHSVCIGKLIVTSDRVCGVVCLVLIDACSVPPLQVRGQDMVPKHVRRSIADVATTLPHGVLQRRVSVVSEPEQVFSAGAPTLEEVRWGGGRGGVGCTTSP